MGRKEPAGRDGKVVCRRSGARWSVEVRLDEENGGQHRIALARTFPTQVAARGAGEEIVAEWKAGQALVRELVLRELAAAYRALREAHEMVEPAAVPTTSAAWERAIAVWEAQRWIGAAAAKRYREHVRSAFDRAGPVTRHPMPAGGDSDVAV